MSISYDIFEHIIITEKCEDWEIRNDLNVMISDHLIRISASILNNSMWDCHLKLVVDGKTLEFEGTVLTEKFQNLFQATDEAKSIELEIGYNYIHHCLYYLNPDPFKFTEYFDEVIKENGTDMLKGVFYSMYNNADCSECEGFLVAYGEKNNRMYTGEIDAVKLNALPEDYWYSSQSYMILELKPDELKNKDEIGQLCTDITEFCDDYELAVDDDGISFEFWNFMLNNNAELEKFAALYGKLINATDNKVLTKDFEFVSGSDDFSIVQIRVNDDGTADINCISTDL